MNKLLNFLLASWCLMDIFVAVPAWGATTNVNMIGNRFVPPNLTISFGDTVTWTNLDNTRHDTVSGVNGVPSPGWRSPLFGIRGSYSFTFTNMPVGVRIPYYCTPHWQIGMVGSVTVLPPNSPPTVSIDSPTNSAIIAVGLAVVIQATAADSDGNVVRVDFFADGNPIGADGSIPYSITFANPSFGPHELRAVAVDNRGGTSVPAIVNLTAIEPPQIDVQPGDLSLNEGDVAVFDVVVSGAPPLSFQWRFNGIEIAGATNSSLAVNPVTTNNVGEYVVVVSNPALSVTSRPATLSVIPLPVVTLTSPPNGARYPVGVPVAVTADATNANGIGVRVEFLINNLVVGLVSNAPFGIVLSNLAAGTYELVARAINDLGGRSTSESMQVSVHDPPLISIIYPTNGSVFPTNAIVRVTNVVSSIGATVTNVEFLANNTPVAEGAFPFIFDWQPVAAGIYLLTAIATDDLGQRAISANVTNRIFIPENFLPTIAITSSPPNFARRTTSMVALSGRASDDVGLDRVEFQVNHGPFLESIGAVQLATGTTNWTTPEIMLSPGNNSVLVRSVDLARNVSFDETRFFTYVVTDSLTLTVTGSGTVTPNLADRPLEIGQIYTIKAVPSSGYVFAGWSFSGLAEVGNSNNATLSFVMQSNLVLAASFTNNPFTDINGNYAGLFYNTNAPALDSSGFFTVQVGSLGAFTGKLMMDGQRFSFRGLFNNEHHANVFVPRRRLAPISMMLDLDPAAGELRGSVTNGLWTAELLGHRNAVQFLSPPAPQAGSYRFRFETETGTIVGTNSAKINPAGRVRFRGSLDGRKISMASSISENGDSPFYVSPKGGNEAIIGWLRFPANEMMSHGTNIFWIRSTTTGFPLRLDAVGAP
jgi:plastocyanin